MKVIDPLTGVRRMFYLVTPWETSFEKLEDVPKYVEESFPYFFLFIMLEYLLCLFWDRTKKARLNDSIGSLSAGVISRMPDLFCRSIELSIYIWVYDNYRLMELPWDSPWTWLLCFLGEEMAYYWLHRMAHEMNLAWSGHQVHHSSETYNLTTALRQSVFQRYFAWFYYLPLAVVIPPSVFLVHIQFNLLYQFWIHTEVIRSLGPLEWVLNTPSHHRVHHGRNPYCIDKNYGGTLIIFDRMFGTFQAEDDREPLAYGLVHPLTSLDPVEIQLCHLKYVWRTFWQRQGWQAKLSTLLKGPGWAVGKPRLGSPADIPPVSGPVPFYDPIVPVWIQSYALVHFVLVLLMSFSLLALNPFLAPLVRLAATLYILLGLKAVGNLLDGTTLRYGMQLEMVRCLLFLLASWAVQTGQYAEYYNHWVIMPPLQLVFLFSAGIWINRLYRHRYFKDTAMGSKDE